jgi:hypothetical protein
MSFYTAAIKTQIHDPRMFADNKRCEFRLDDENAVYLSNLRLGNVGITANTDSYNFGTGAYEVIQRLSLYDGNTLLDQQLEFPKYTAFKNYMKPNESNRSLQSFLSGNGMGYEVVGADASGSPAQIKETFGAAQYNQTAPFEGWLDLKSCLPFLRNIPYLPTNVFKNLRLEIEFNAAVGSSQNTERPILIGDEMVEETTKMKLMNQFKQFQYVSVEHDSIHIDDVAGLSAEGGAGEPSRVQQVSKQLKGFDNKLVNRLVIIKSPTGATAGLGGLSTQLGQNGSILGFREKENLRVNGRNLLVGDGIDTSAKSLAHLTDIYGTGNTFCNRRSLPDSALGGSILGLVPAAVLGEQDYRAFRVGERVEQMELQFERTGVFDSASSPPQAHTSACSLTLNVFAEVVKVLSVQPDGSYLIAYV